ncbi:MAG: ABC transporter ATP-binding protein/permease [Saprospiraceae bacterium]|nr:ABC transporter ATP-binding protein/permease [Saprospiraceae bacterium]
MAQPRHGERFAPPNLERPFREQFAALRHLPPFLALVWRTHPPLALANLLLRLVKSILPLAILYVGKLILDQVVGMIETPGLDATILWQWVGLELILVFLSDMLNRAINLVDSLLGDLVSNQTSYELIRHAATLDLFQFENPEFYDKLERARRQTTGRTVLISQILTQVQDVISILALGAGLLFFNPWLILILIVAVLPAFLGESYFNQQSYSLTRSWTPERRELDYLRFIGASDQTAKEVKIFGLADFLANRFKVLAHRYFLANRRIAIRRAGWGAALGLISTAAYYGAYVLIIQETIAGLITIGTLTFLAGSFDRMRGLLQGLMSRFSTIAEASLYLQDLFDFFAIEPEISSPTDPIPFPHPIQKGFTFEGVSFKYPGTDKWVLRDLTFTLTAGEKLALVGENGAGKTTLVKLLARLYEPTEGRILLDVHDLRSYDLATLRDNVGIIFQDFQKFSLPAGENIAVGHIDQIHDQARIESSAAKSLADEVIRELPNGYDQVLGRRFADSVDLSGGQWQKIALARAYMRDAQLLILDEPTSALDARAEHEVFVRFAELISGRSAVLISHRFSTVRMADRIIVLQSGRIVEMGSHEELMQKEGLYAELFRLQAQGYQ